MAARATAGGDRHPIDALLKPRQVVVTPAQVVLKPGEVPGTPTSPLGTPTSLVGTPLSAVDAPAEIGDKFCIGLHILRHCPLVPTCCRTSARRGGRVPPAHPCRRDALDLRARADDRWYVPDPKKEGNLERLRLRTPLREFADYKTSLKRRIEQFHTEAVRAGFKHCLR